MNKIILACIVCCSWIAQAQAQDKTVLCHDSKASDKFAKLANSQEFRDVHQQPRNHTHRSKTEGTMITLPCNDGKEANAYLLRASKASDYWIFVFQEWWGLNDNIKQWSEDLHHTFEHVNILALDMYDGKIATNRKTAQQYMQAFSQKRGNAIVKGALSYAGTNAKVATIGWCFGGGQSLQAALVAGKQSIGCVMYYGMPEENVERLKTLQTDVLNIWASRDQWINKEVMNKFEKNMEKAQKKITIYTYDAEHAFANPSNSSFNEKAYADAREKTMAYFKSKFK